MQMSTAHVCSKRSLATASFARSDLLRTARGQPPRQIAKISWSTDRFVSSGAMISYWSDLRCFAGAICGVSDVPNAANPACRHGPRVAVPLFRACMLGAGQQPVIFFLRNRPLPLGHCSPVPGPSPRSPSPRRHRKTPSYSHSERACASSCSKRATSSAISSSSQSSAPHSHCL